MTDRDRNADWNRDVLERIVALLLALANLADLAAGASFLRRRRVLGIVGYGEAAARAFVIGMACDARISADALDTTCDAALLAVRLRALASMLCVILARVPPAAPRVAAGPGAGREMSARRAGRHAAPPAPDTS
jgi:hypothetical protein